MFVYLIEPGLKVQKKGGQYVVLSKEGEILHKLPSATIEGILLIDKVQITSEALADFMRRNIPVCWIKATGEILGQVIQPGAVHVHRQVQQLKLIHSDFALQMQQGITAAKIHNQFTLLRKHNRQEKNRELDINIQRMSLLKKLVTQKKSRDEIMGYEGLSAKYYFQSLGKLVPEDFVFSKRSKRPPKDKFNALLSFGYTLLFQEIFTTVTSEGLHPYFGFMHELKEHHPALISDLLEEWRVPIIDVLVLGLVRRGLLTAEDFIQQEKAVYLRGAGKRAFLESYEKRISEKGHKEASYRDMIHRQVSAFAQALMAEDANIYCPYKMR